MQDAVKSISLRELNWVDVDSFANNHGFKDRSPFVEYCVAKEMHKHKLGNMKVFEIVMLLMMAMITLLLFLR